MLLSTKISSKLVHIHSIICMVKTIYMRTTEIIKYFVVVIVEIPT